MSDLVGNPEDRFSQNEAQISVDLILAGHIGWVGMKCHRNDQSYIVAESIIK